MKPEDRPAPERHEGEATRAFLARVLEAEGAPQHMVSLAAEGHYDDYLSPLPMPELQLHADAREAGLPQIASWVEQGVFDGTREESEAWARSPEGQAVFRELTQGPNRAQRRAKERRERRHRR